MSDKAWKQVERRIARYLGTRRTPLSGGNDGRTRSDSLHSSLFIEVKHGKRAEAIWRSRKRLLRLFEDTATKAADERKVPVVVLHPPRFGGGIGNYPAYVTTEVSRPAATVGDGRKRKALLLPRNTVVCVPLYEIRHAIPFIEEVPT
ncbi:MAG: hypothetical protein WCB19_07465 [Thermoplasmata archaeon]